MQPLQFLSVLLLNVLLSNLLFALTGDSSAPSQEGLSRITLLWCCYETNFILYYIKQC